MLELRQQIRMAKAAPKKTLAEEYGKRLRIARKAAGLTIRTLAREAFAPTDDADLARAENNVSKWENGAVEIPPSAIDSIGRVISITHSYIYGANRASLPPEVAERIQKFERDMGRDE